MASRSGKNVRAAIVAPLVAVVVASCGGSAQPSASQALSRALHPASPLRSGRLYESFALTPQGSSSTAAPVALTVSGPFVDRGAGQPPDLSLAVTTTNGGRTSTVGMVVTGAHLYLAVAGASYVTPQTVYAALARSYSQAAARGAKAPTFNSLGVDPAAWLRGAHDAGTATLDGVRVRHITSALDVSRFVSDLGRVSSAGGALGVGQLTGGQASLSPSELANVRRSIRAATVDAYVGADDGILRRLAIDAAVVPNGGGRAPAARLSFALSYSGVNRPQSIVAPAGAKPLSVLAAELQRAGVTRSDGTQTQQTTQTQTTQSQTATPPSVAGAAPPAYLRCVVRAGQDLVARARCAPLLNGG